MAATVAKKMANICNRIEKPVKVRILEVIIAIVNKFNLNSEIF